VPDHAARSNSERAGSSARVGNQFWFLRPFGINRIAALARKEKKLRPYQETTAIPTLLKRRAG
jgi:hypothetical protein